MEQNASLVIAAHKSAHITNMVKKHYNHAFNVTKTKLRAHEHILKFKVLTDQYAALSDNSNVRTRVYGYILVVLF